MGGERRLAPAGDRGQTAVEFITVLGLIALVIAVLAASSVVTLVRATTRAAVCDTLSQDPCHEGSAPAAPAAAPPSAAADPSWSAIARRVLGDLVRAVDQTRDAFLNGATYGDFNRTGYTNPWHETARAAGHLASGLLLYGDLRDATAALQRLWQTNGHQGWSDLGWSTLGIIPIAGDLARGLRTLDHLADSTRLLNATADVRRATDEADDLLRPLGNSVGAARGLQYEPSPKHGPRQRGRIAPAPVNGQEALDQSLQIKTTSMRRVGIDYESGQFVVFDETHPNSGIFHGHARPWSGRDGLGSEMQNALLQAGLVTRRGRIVGDGP